MTPTPVEARSLQRRFRWLTLAVSAPILALLALLIGREYQAQIGRDLEFRLIAARARIAEIGEIVRAANVHVVSLHYAVEASLSPALPLPSLPPATFAATGDKPVDVFGEPSPAAMRTRGVVIALPDRFRQRPPADREVDAALSLFPQQAAALAAQPFLRWSYYFSARRDFVAIYPWANVASFLGDADPAATFAGYFDYNVFRMTLPEQNPRRDAIWTPVYFDAGGAGLMVSHNAPVYHDNRFVGMVGADVLLSVISARLAQETKAPDLFLVADQAGSLVADSRGVAAGADKLVPASDLLPLGGLSRDTFQAIGDKHIFTAAVAGTPWTFAYAVPLETVRAAAREQILPYVIYLIGLAAALIFGAAVIRALFIRPAFQLVGAIDELAAGRQSEPPRVPASWRPWVEHIYDTFSASRRATDELQQARAKSAAIIDVALDAVVTTDVQGRVTDFNPAAEAMFGRTAAEAAGRRIGDLIVPEHLRNQHEAGLERQQAGTAKRLLGKRVELDALHASGRTFPVEIQIHELPHVQGVRYAAYIRDLTEQKRSAREIADQRERLYQAEKLTAMGSLLAGLAHELNNPLAIAIAQTTMLEETTEDAGTRARAAKIRIAAERCSRIVRTFLSMARKQPPKRSLVDLPRLVSDSIEVIGYGLRSAGIDVVQRHAANLPPLEADADQLTQVIVNLVINAQQAFGDRPGARSIFIETVAQADGTIALIVADNGPGVPAAIRESIFEAFFTTKPVGAGTGVGLAVCRNIVEAHGGRIAIEDRPGGGALFRVSLPSKAAEPGREPAAAEIAAPESTAARGASGLAILIVDDEPEVAEALSGYLQRDGHGTTVARSVSEGIAESARRRFDLVFCDLRMPGGGGIAFWDLLSERDPALARRVVFVTGDMVAGPEALRRAAGSRALHILEKPFARQDVRAMVERVAAALSVTLP